jgi:diamine N-acetyltransferase
MITLRPVTKENYLECIRLKVAPDQETFVASNAVSLVQAVYEEGAIPRAIYEDEMMVGFIMAQYIPTAPMPYIWRLMIEASHQGKGYGKAAMNLMLDHLKAISGCQRIAISYAPENQTARQLYARLGFVETGEMEDDEVVAHLVIADSAEGSSV